MPRFNLPQQSARLLALAACALIVPAMAQSAPPSHAASTTHRATAATAVSAAAKSTTNMIGSFEGKTVKDKKYGTLIKNGADESGWGWAATTDQRMGGKSSVTLSMVHPGANGTHGALRVAGEVKNGFMSPWAGTVWFPGSRPMQPADLSAKNELTFWTRGQPGSYTLMLMAGSPRSMPIYASFDVTGDWTQVTIPLQRSFPAADLHKVYFIAFAAANWGKFQFDLDDVQLR